ncbi:MAG: aminodeoxychorismate synthase component I [Pseudomonadales bacterium]|nr:aminodeoxychorismate synthase component I [Pseudomonadales bacterium]
MHTPLIEPTVEAIPYQTDSTVYLYRVRKLGRAVFIDSCSNQIEGGRYDIVSAEPAFTINHTYISPTQTNATGTTKQPSPFEKIRRKLAQSRSLGDPPQGLPFMGGFIGYLGYESGMELEGVQLTADRKVNLPDIKLGWYEWAVVNDHLEKRCFLVALPGFDKKKLSSIKNILVNSDATKPANIPFKLKTPFISNTTFSQYSATFEKVIDYIHAGDCYQVNLSQQFSSSYSGDTWDAYQRLREATPSPYSAYMEFDQGALLSLSPEQFISLNRKQVATHPIKGTRPRGDSKKDDLILAQALETSAKDRAENLMIVDLLRNDLGKSCVPGSIEVAELFKLRSFSNVHHLVSSITGTLRDDTNSIDLLTGCFPGGSITGAPKRRAMEIIAELEPHNRSLYCGSIGYIGANGDINMNIAIRTLVCDNNKIYCWGGGGIVADSEVEMEYQECFDKIDRLINCLPLS